MAERKHRAVRMGIDVGGTYTKCVAMDVSYRITCNNGNQRTLINP